MAVIATAKPWGYVFTSSGGTAVAAALTAQIPKSTNLRVLGITVGGAAATDITRVYDGAMNMVFQGSASATMVSSITFPAPITITGIAVGMSGATTGFCNLYLE